jgi:hypothetical protein
MARAEAAYPRLGDIPVEDIRAGKVWKLELPEDHDFDAPLADWGPVFDAEDFDAEDTIVYSGLLASIDGRATPLLLVRELGAIDYGGDYLEHVEGAWHPVGFLIDTDASIGDEYIADPHPRDPSFEGSEDFRAWHRRQFALRRDKLKD